MPHRAHIRCDPGGVYKIPMVSERIGSIAIAFQIFRIDIPAPYNQYCSGNFGRVQRVIPSTTTWLFPSQLTEVCCSYLYDSFVSASPVPPVQIIAACGITARQVQRNVAVGLRATAEERQP